MSSKYADIGSKDYPEGKYSDDDHPVADAKASGSNSQEVDSKSGKLSDEDLLSAVQVSSILIAI